MMINDVVKAAGKSRVTREGKKEMMTDIYETIYGTRGARFITHMMIMRGYRLVGIVFTFFN